MTSVPASWLVGAGVAAAVAALAAGQAPAQAPPIFRSGVDVVQLDVSVLDKKRQPVHGLTAADFTVIENGQAQRVMAALEVSVDRAPRPVWTRGLEPDVVSNDVGDKRMLAIVIEGGGPVVPQLIRGVMDRMGPGDVVAVIGGGCYVPLTEDAERLRECLETSRSGGAGSRSSAGVPPTPINERAHSLLRDVTEYLAAASQRRKAILYVGFGPSMGPIGRGGDANERATEDYRETLWNAHLANVNIYAVRAAAVTLRQSLGIPHSFDALKALADQTGGMALANPETLGAGLDQLFRENASYYLVGYQTTHPKMDGKFRELSVKVGRPGVIVRTRTKSYRPALPVPAAGMAADVPTRGLTGRLRDWMPSLDVAFDVAVMPFANPSGADAAVAIVAGLTEPIAPGVTRVVQHVDVRVLAYDDTGTLVTDVTRRVSLDTPPGAENRVRYDVLQQIALAPGRYHLRLTAHNADTDKIGSIDFEVTVPDFLREPISLSGVALTRASSELTSSSGPPEPIVSAVPTATRRFLSGDRVTVLTRVYEAAMEPVAPATVEVRILDAAGVAVYTTSQPIAAERFEASRSVDVRLDLPLDRLRAGQYLLTLQARRDARHTLPRDVRFVVR